MRIRAFLALCLSVPATRRVVEEVERMRRPVADKGVKVAWVPPANLHVTLKFFGSVPEESLEAIIERCRRVLAARAPFAVKARGLGAFPSAADPRVLWVGVDGGEELTRLQAEIEAAMRDCGFAAEERPFHAHVTVARIKAMDRAVQSVRGTLAEVWRGDKEYATSMATELVLYESRTHASGSEYVARAHIPFGLSAQGAATAEVAAQPAVNPAPASDPSAPR